MDSPEPPEAEVEERSIETEEEVTTNLSQAGQQVLQTNPPGDPDTHRTHQIVAVTATTDTELLRGTVWPHTPAPGSARPHHDHEGLEDLDNEIKIITRQFFRK